MSPSDYRESLYAQRWVKLFKGIISLNPPNPPSEFVASCGCGRWSLEGFLWLVHGRAEPDPENFNPRGANMSLDWSQRAPGRGCESLISKGRDSVGFRNRLERKEEGAHSKGWQLSLKESEGRGRRLSAPPCPAHTGDDVIPLHHCFRKVVFCAFGRWGDGSRDLT